MLPGYSLTELIPKMAGNCYSVVKMKTIPKLNYYFDRGNFSTKS